MANYREKLAGLGFSPIEIGAVEFCLLRMGVMECCEHERPKFVECYELDADGSINEARWQKSMREMGFRSNAISLAEHALGLYGDGGAA
jgi:hypothetical protein